MTKRHRPKIATNITVQAVVDELVKAKGGDGLSELHVRDLRTRLSRFAKSFRCPIAHVTKPEIERILRSLCVAKRTRKNSLTTIGNLLNYAKAQGYLPADHPRVSKVAKQRKDPPNIGVLTPDEMGKLLASAKPEIIPALALGAFAGLRSAELARLDWSCIKLNEGHIEVPARCAKTGIRRLPPIPDNLLQWLGSHQKASGPVPPFKCLTHQWLSLAKPTILSSEIPVDSHGPWRRAALSPAFRQAQSPALPRPM